VKGQERTARQPVLDGAWRCKRLTRLSVMSSLFQASL
jgi:hypothetical protein